jgi:hypothetical protein
LANACDSYPQQFSAAMKKMVGMKLIRRAAGFRLLVRRRRGDTVEELDMDPIEYKSAQYKQKWSNHLRKLQNI